MKQVTFLRHAKSDWANENIKDVDRPLNNRGYADAYAMSEWFLEKKQLPDVIFSSHATRALTTALIFARTLQFNLNQFSIDALLYETNLNYLYEFIRNQKKENNHVMIVGHNPATTLICYDLLKKDFVDNLPTCALISINFNVNNWKKIESKMGELNFYQVPKETKY
jgi:phosphohistidine phosphatase